ncbi:nucleotidyltransferase AbiEii toxin of type IV toxin-antitoxin system [Dyadobacter jejuensis]|uniref:Nucleotidyltransferase AbiEii toxin of type IV toxin-antitoxin system n=1 Tax=Dyadobacter jejuensis TaxID=1082580 RepID=A0A316AMK1_9BACT|nr:nucleotidyl transferase AbiEii/AbiGii toxin family protein [Dyadobacter jejuensis]PWJ58304.1 nucleotidyltransferase AbiEii toxin of type IV toxin-antitoxin system [Dyadobacter jejuensis]
MIKEHCFTDEWLEGFKKQKDHKRIDKIILEKMIYALHLLERLKSNGLHFVFKGGTSLVLLLESGNRFSIDIDIISKTDRKELEDILQKVIDSSNFTSVELDEHRSYKPGVPKAHYKFKFDSARQGSGTILLDILIEDSIYPDVIEKPVITKWIETENETMVTMPSIDSITGDKLTAFAPNTIGIPYFKGKDQQPFSMEICKQLFDLSKLFENIQNMEVVAASFQVFAEHEIFYRKKGTQEAKLTPEMVLQDTIDTCIILAKRDSGNDDEKAKFKELQKGIIAFGTGFLIAGNFRIDDAIPASARIAYLVAKIKVNDLSPIIYYEGQDIKDLMIEDKDWTFLNKLKKQPDKSSFFYWFKTVELLTAKK